MTRKIARQGKDKTDKDRQENPLTSPPTIALSPEAAKIANVVREDPGCNIKQTRERTGLGRCVFDAALKVAIRAGTVHRISHGYKSLLFPDHDEIDKVAPQLIALKDEDTSQLYWFLYHQHEINDRQEILQYAEQEFGWDSSRTRWRLYQLEEAGLLKAFQGWQDRRHARYRCFPIHPCVMRVFETTNKP